VCVCVCVCVLGARLVVFVSYCSRRLLSLFERLRLRLSLSLSSTGKSSGALLAHVSNEVGCPLEALPPRARARGGPCRWPRPRGPPSLLQHGEGRAF
jgi:hypothetical protein